MSVDALFNTTMALRRRIADATRENGNEIGVHVGAPVHSDGNDRIALTLFDVQPSAALRNTPRFAPAPTTGPVAGPGAPIEAIALELRYLIVCYGPKTIGNEPPAEPNELRALGRIVAALHLNPTLSVAAAPDPDADQAEQDAALAEQIVRLSLESYGLDDWNRLWALFPETAFRTSIVYLATPVYVAAGATRLYPRVQSRESRSGVSAGPPGGNAA